MDLAAKLEVLEVENEILRERVSELEKQLGRSVIAPIEWGLTPSETCVFGVLASREVATKDAIMAALYHNVGRDAAAVKIINVLICKIRKKLVPFGVVISTAWGQGWMLDARTRAALKAKHLEAAE